MPPGRLGALSLPRGLGVEEDSTCLDAHTPTRLSSCVKERAEAVGGFALDPLAGEIYAALKHNQSVGSWEQKVGLWHVAFNSLPELGQPIMLPSYRNESLGVK